MRNNHLAIAVCVIALVGVATCWSFGEAFGNGTDDNSTTVTSFTASDVRTFAFLQGATLPSGERNMSTAVYYGQEAKLSDDCWYYYGTHLKFENVTFMGEDFVDINSTDLPEMEVCFNVFHGNNWDPTNEDTDSTLLESANFWVTDVMTGKDVTWPANVQDKIMNNGQEVSYKDIFAYDSSNTTTMKFLNGSLYTPSDDTRDTAGPNGGNKTFSYHHKWCLKNPDFTRFFPEKINPQPNNTVSSSYGNESNGSNVTYTAYTVEVNVLMSNLQERMNGTGPNATVSQNSTCYDRDDPKTGDYKNVVSIQFCDLSGTICTGTQPSDNDNLRKLVQLGDSGTTYLDFAPVLRFSLPAKDDSDFNWLLWGGVGLAAVVIIVLIIVFAVKGKGDEQDDEDQVSLQKNNYMSNNLKDDGGYDDTGYD